MLVRTSQLLGTILFGILMVAGATQHADTARITYQSTSWTSPSLVFVPEYIVGDGLSRVLADSSGRLHVFFSYTALDKSGEPLPEYPYNTILYTFSDDGIVWTPPVDVFIPDAPKPWQGAGIDGVIDSQGTIHLVFSGNSTNDGVLKYASAHVSTASDPHTWRNPSGDWGMAVSQATVVVDDHNRLHLAYSARPNNIYYRYSDDRGVTWSDDSVIAETDPNVSYPDDIALAVDSAGRIHATWSENKAPEAYPPSGVYYAFSDDIGQSWSQPEQLGGQYATRVAMALRDPNEVHAVWSTSLQERGRYAAVSRDGGDTWSQAELVARYETGLSTYPEQIFTDSSGTLYWVLTGEEGDYLTTAPPGNGWTPPVQLTFPPSVGWQKASLTSGTSGVIAQGNQLHLLVREGPRPQQAENDRYWHTMLILDAPALSPEPVPTLTPTPTIQPDVLPSQNAMPSPSPTLLATPLPATVVRPSGNLGLAASFLPAVILVLAVIGYQFTRRGRR